MKKIVLIVFTALFVIGFTSCKKEVIEIVTTENEAPFFNDRSTNLPNPTISDSLGFVTDPNEDEDFDADKKNTGK